MVEMSDDVRRVLESVIARSDARQMRHPLPGDITVHAIERAEAVGPGRALAGCLIVETPDGAMRRMTGMELTAFAELNPGFVRTWAIEG